MSNYQELLNKFEKTVKETEHEMAMFMRVLTTVMPEEKEWKLIERSEEKLKLTALTLKIIGAVIEGRKIKESIKKKEDEDEVRKRARLE